MNEFIKNARDAELAAARSMRTLGFADASATPIGPDAGLDVTSRTALAQVKWKGGVAGRPDLQRLYGACAGQHHKAMLFYSASGYSKSAIEYAAQVQIALFDYDPYGQANPQNPIAANLVRKVRQNERERHPERTGTERANQLPGTGQTDDPDLHQWMTSTGFMQDPKLNIARKPSWRDNNQRRTIEPPGRTASISAALILLGLAVLSGWLFVELITGSLPLTAKLLLGIVLALGGLFFIGTACVAVYETRHPTKPPT